MANPDRRYRTTEDDHGSVQPRPRPVIGFVTGNLHVGAARALWPGVLDAAVNNDANLICFPGGRLQAPDDFEMQRNALYDLIDARRLDGLVSWASTLTGTLGTDRVAEFHRRYGELPMVSLASSLADGPTISIDSYMGMRAAALHLMDVHGFSRLALLRGPAGHFYAQERYRAYCDVLEERGIALEPALVSPPLSWEKGAEAMQILLDERRLQPGRHFQAVLAASDFLALGALRTLNERGIRVPGDVALAGFNALAESQLTRPPLTSVALPFYDQGRKAVETLLAMMAGQEVPGQVVLESRLLVRQSCGCPWQSLALAAAEPIGDHLEPRAAFPTTRERLAAQIALAGDGGERASVWAEQLLDAFYAELTGALRGVFLPALDGMLRQRTPDGDEIEAWHAVISLVRRELLPGLKGQARLRAEDLFGQARLVIGEAAQRVQIARQLEAQRQADALRDIGQALITTFDVDRLADVLSQRLPGLGIASCYLALYEDPAHSLEWSRLVLAYNDRGRVELEPGGRRFPSCRLVPEEWLPDRRYSLVVEPLYFQAEQIGFVAFEIGPEDGSVYEVLRGHISSALKGALLLREAHDARLIAEKANQIKTRLLANVSHELRTPLNIIIGHTERALEAPVPHGMTPPAALLTDLEHIQGSAEHQLRIIDDLLDLSRAEINELDLYPQLLEPRLLLEEAFVAMAEDAAVPGVLTWRLDLPETLPAIHADPVRLRQILLNLLSNARKFTEHGHIVLGGRVEAPYLHLWVADSGPGIPADQLEHVFEPFITGDPVGQRQGGIGLGLSITRHLVALHGGTMALDSQPGRGSTFHVYLPLAGAQGDYAWPLPSRSSASIQPILWLIAPAEDPPAEIAAFGRRQGLAIRWLDPATRQAWSKPDCGDLEDALAEGLPAGIAWDMAGAGPEDWTLIRRLHNHPLLANTPLVLSDTGQAVEGCPAPASGLASLVVKPASSQALLEAIRPTLPDAGAGLVLIIDDDEQAREMNCQAVRQGLPDYRIRTAGGGSAGLAAMAEEVPDLVILDLMMPGLDGFEVLDRMRGDERTRQVPVVILSGRRLNLDDIRRLEHHGGVTLQSKGIQSQDEIVAALHRVLFGSDSLPPLTSALAKRAVAYLHQNYARSLARWEIADAIGVSEDYLSRVFQRDLGISPWDYLNRYRIDQAKALLRATDDSVSSIARAVGFADSAYFSRVFRKITDLSPSAYRANPGG